MHLRWDGYQTVHQPRNHIHAEVYFQTVIPGFALERLVHLRVPGLLLIPGRGGGHDQRESATVPAPRRNPRAARCWLMQLSNTSPWLRPSSRLRKLGIVVSSESPPRRSPAKRGSDSILYSSLPTPVRCDCRRAAGNAPARSSPAGTAADHGLGAGKTGQSRPAFLLRGQIILAHKKPLAMRIFLVIYQFGKRGL